MNNLSRWGLLGILVLAAGIRFVHLADRSLWFDEAFSWRLVQFPPAEFLTRAAADVHPILYYILLWGWLRLLAFIGVDASLFALRSLSVVLSVATVGAMFWAGRTLFRSSLVGLASALLTAVNAFQVQYAWEARMYPLGALLTVLAMIGLFRAATAERAREAWRAGIGFGVALGALLHTHYYALFSWLAIGTTKLLYFAEQWWKYLWGDPSPDPSRGGSGLAVVRSRTTLRRRFLAAEVGFWLSALLFLPWLPIFLQQIQRVQDAYWIPKPHAWSIPNTMAKLFWGGVDDPARGWAVIATIGALGLILIPIIRGRSLGDLIAAASFAIPVIVSGIISFRTSVYLDRYFLFAQLGLILLAARTLSLLPQRLRTGLLFAVVVGGLFSVTQLWQSLDFPARPGARAAAQHLLQHAQPGEVILASSPFAYFPIGFHMGCTLSSPVCGDELRVHLFTEGGELLHFAGGPILTPRDVAGPEIFQQEELRAPFGALWVVDTTGFGGSRLAVPAVYALTQETRYPELFAYQGDIIVREYHLMSREGHIPAASVEVAR